MQCGDFAVAMERQRERNSNATVFDNIAVKSWADASYASVVGEDSGSGVFEKPASVFAVDVRYVIQDEDEDELSTNCSVSDSEFGLSYRQRESLEALHSLLDPQLEDVTQAFSLTDDEDVEESADVPDADYGLCEQQLLMLQGLHDGCGPLRVHSESDCTQLDNMCESAQKEGSQCELQEAAEDLMRIVQGLHMPKQPHGPCQLHEAAEDLVRAVQASLRPRRQAILVSQQTSSDSVTWYLWQVDEAGERRFYWKQYTDFVKLDRALRKINIDATLPDLPQEARFGIGMLLNIGDFHGKRRQGLQQYVNALNEVLDSKEPGYDHLAKEFFGLTGNGRIS